jgi:hypothetical protein
LTLRATAYGAAGQAKPGVRPPAPSFGVDKGGVGGDDPDFSNMTQAEKIA